MCKEFCSSEDIQLPSQGRMYHHWSPRDLLSIPKMMWSYWSYPLWQELESNIPGDLLSPLGQKLALGHGGMVRMWDGKHPALLLGQDERNHLEDSLWAFWDGMLSSIAVLQSYQCSISGIDWWYFEGTPKLYLQQTNPCGPTGFWLCCQTKPSEQDWGLVLSDSSKIIYTWNLACSSSSLWGQNWSLNSNIRSIPWGPMSLESLWLYSYPYVLGTLSCLLVPTHHLDTLAKG